VGEIIYLVGNYWGIAADKDDETPEVLQTNKDIL
jgi:hypothetical protein